MKKKIKFTDLKIVEEGGWHFSNLKTVDELVRKLLIDENHFEYEIKKKSLSDFVPAKLRLDGNSVKANIRLKGDLLDHFGPRKWSFRVHVKGEDQLFGLRRFSIQAPRTRQYQREPIYLAHLRREGILAVDYFFVKVRLNGENIGIMAVEEHFSKELLQRQRRREGIIIKFNGDDWWNYKSKYFLDTPYRDYRVAEILPFRPNWVNKSDTLKAISYTPSPCFSNHLVAEWVDDSGVVKTKYTLFFFNT